MTALVAIAAYLAVAYWLFWVDLIDPDDDRTMIVVRAALHLTIGPLMLAVIWAAALAAKIERDIAIARARHDALLRGESDA